MSLSTTAIIVLHRSDDDSDGHECTVQTLKGPLPVADVKQDLCETLQGFYQEYEQLGFEQGLQKNVVQRAFRRWKATTTDSEHPISKAVVEDFYSLATDIFWHHKHDVTGLTDSNTPEELKTDKLEKVVHVLINGPTVEKKPSVSQHTPVEKGEKKGSGDVTSPTKGPIQTTLTLVPRQQTSGGTAVTPLSTTTPPNQSGHKRGKKVFILASLSVFSLNFLLCP
ncbi:hypothetical protein CYMTET_30725 [Cymbomonas tetramitiformis]|uniref:Uncharacterized protein n=1 Tax=Cymbomonas tetramitiformis TaxID=36881 RepID=A0AAE0FIQ7_9CHLO|nr:hypothetical protein CYMTET_30725 [Cymbomonas tetramitiformis]